MSLAEDVHEKLVNIDDMVVENHAIQLRKDLYWDYDKFPNALITGGLGKTSLLFSLTTGLIRSGAVVDVAQLGAYDWVPLGRSKALNYRVFYSQDKILRALNRFTLEMRVRLNELRKLSVENKNVGGTYLDYGLKPHFFVIDNLATIMTIGDYKFANTLTQYMTEIELLGRSAGFQMVIGTTDPKADVLPSVIKQQINFRVVLGFQTDVYYNMALGFVPDFEDDQFNQILQRQLYGVGVAYLNQPLGIVAPKIPDDFDMYAYFEKLGEEYPAENAPGIRELEALLGD